MNKRLKRIGLILSVAVLGVGIGLSTLTFLNSSSVGVQAAGPYKVLGDFNGWSGTEGTKDITEFTTNIGAQKVYYAKHTIYGEWKVHGSDVTWLGVGNLNDQAKGAGFSGTDNIISPDAEAPGSEYTFFIYEEGNRINVIKDAFLAGNMNGWATADETLKFTQNASSPWIFTFDTSLAAAATFKVNFGAWDGALGHYNMTASSATYGFLSSGEPDHNIVAGTGFYPGDYTITLDIVNYLVDISPKAATIANELMDYPTGEETGYVTANCAINYDYMKPRVVGLSDSELNIFKTSLDSNIVSARERYTSWALANGDDTTEMYVIEEPAGSLFEQIGYTDNMLLIIVSISIVGLTSLAGLYILRKKRA